MSAPITFQINGRSLSLAAPRTIIEAADQLGIYIPRFCYHKKLSVVANCRMCLVEVEGLPKPVPACATAVAPNMHVLTKSEKTKAAQQAVMEFLLINHPLDCPICDQGGQCELQDLTMRYARDHSNFDEMKRAVPNDDLGSLVSTEMTRCIQCTRCVRFGSEIAGQMELAATGRGEHMQITTHVKQHLKSELSGNMIDLCPVGALTSKPFRFKARAWELRSTPSIAPHDCLGSHVYVHTHDQQVMRVVPRENDSINEAWLSDRDRYAYLGLMHPERLSQPMLKVEGSWQVTDWNTALEKAAHLLKASLDRYGTESLGGLISPSATLEEMYCFQDLCRRLGSFNIDHRLHEIDTRDQEYLPQLPYSEIAISDLEECDVVILVGSNIQREQPLLITRLRKVVARGGRIVSLNCVDYDFSFEVAHKIIVSPDQLTEKIAILAQYCDTSLSEQDLIQKDPVLKEIVAQLHTAQTAAILTGAISRNHPQAAYLRYQIQQVAVATGAKTMHLTEGANSTGAWIAGAVPHRLAGGKRLISQSKGMAAHEMLQKRLSAYLLFNIEPNLDCANPQQAQAAIDAADCVIAFTAFASSSLLANAQVLLPIHCFGENTGTFVNIEGQWQSFLPSLPGVGDSRPGWEVLVSLAKALEIEEKDDITLAAIREKLKHASLESEENQTQQLSPKEITLEPIPVNTHQSISLVRITEWPLYSIDPLVRRAVALQKSASHEKTAVYIHPECAKRLMLQPGQKVRLRQGEGVSEWLPIMTHLGIPENCVWTPAARFETSQLGDSFGSIEILHEEGNL